MLFSESPSLVPRRDVLKAGFNCLLAGALSGPGVLSAQSGPPTGPATARVTVFGNQLGPRIDPRFFGVGLMYWTEDDERLADGHIAAELKALKCRLLRFPGGTESDDYLWNTHRLADKRRWPWKDGPGTMDTDEFIALCRKVGADPLICVNTEIAAFESLEAGAKLAADWVRYCNIEKKYGVVFWEIGNEPYYHTRFTPAEYGRLFLAYAKAMKAVDPTIKLAAVGEWNVRFQGMKERIPEPLREEAMRLEYANEIGTKPRVDLDPMQTRKDGDRWWATVLEAAGSEIDLASFHFYFAPDYELPKMSESIAKIQELCREKVPGKTIPLISTEWSMGDWVQTFGLQRALAVAEAAGKMIQAGVMMSTYWPLSCKGDHERKSLLDSWTRKRTANYQVLELMANTIGERCIGSADVDSGVYSLATQSANGRGITLYLINRTDRRHAALDVGLPGLRSGSFGAKLLSANDPKTNDTTLVTIPCEATAGGCRLELPAWSMAVVRCSIEKLP
jgi:alpha-L-arabinofuranosidase